MFILKMAKKHCFTVSTCRLLLYTLCGIMLTTTLIMIRYTSVSDTVVRLAKTYTSTLFTDPTNIFMVETKLGKRRLSSREACNVESAALHHPRSQLILCNTNGPFQLDDPYISNLLVNYPNIKVLPLNVSELFRETPLENRITSLKNNETDSDEDLNIAVRIALLWKYGGIYLDTDVITVNSMSNLSNTLGLDYHKMASESVLIFKQNSSLLYEYMAEMNLNFMSNTKVDEELLTKLLKEQCNVNSLDKVVNNPTSCRGIDIQPMHIFYPLEWYSVWKLFFVPLVVSLDYSHSFTVRTFHNKMVELKAQIGTGSHIEIMSKKFCPSSYRLMQEVGTI